VAPLFTRTPDDTIIKILLNWRPSLPNSVGKIIFPKNPPAGAKRVSVFYGRSRVEPRDIISPVLAKTVLTVFARRGLFLN